MQLCSAWSFYEIMACKLMLDILRQKGFVDVGGGFESRSCCDGKTETFLLNHYFIEDSVCIETHLCYKFVK